MWMWTWSPDFKWFAAKKVTEWQMVKLLSDGKNKADDLFSSKNMVTENIQGRLKMKFPYCNCFPAITKLTEGLQHYMLLNQEQMFWSYWKTDILMFLIYSYFTLSKSKECLLKYDKNSYTNIVTIWTVLGKTVSRNVLLCNYRLWSNFAFIQKWKN